MMIFEGEKILLKEFTLENLYDPIYFSWLRNYEVVKYIYRMEYLMPLQFDEVEKYVKNLFESKNDCLFAIYHKDDNKFIGTFKVGHIDWRSGVADIGLMIGDKDYTGRGLSNDILITGCRYAFKNLCMRKLVGGTAFSNVAMCKSFERSGFIKEGVLRKQLFIEGNYDDHIYYGMFRDELILKEDN